MISFNLNIYKEAFNEYIKYLLNVDFIKSNNILDQNYDEVSQNKNGIQLEEIIIEQLWNNQLDVDNIPENNKIIINDIYSIKSFKDEGYNVEKNNIITIRQNNFNGKYYDLVLIVNDEEKKIAIFIKIGINITSYEINKYYNNLIRYLNEYKSGIGFLIKDKIDALGLLFIFDYDKQLSLKNKENEGVGYCSKNKIVYLIYRDFKLFDSLNSDKPVNVTSIDAKKTIVIKALKYDGLILLKNSLKENFEKMIDIKLEPFISIDDSQKKQIIKFINGEYNQNFDDLEFVTNLGVLIKGNINLGNLINDFVLNIIEGYNHDKYFSYNNNMYKINKKNIIDELTPIEEYTFSKKQAAWDLYLLAKKRKRNNSYS